MKRIFLIISILFFCANLYSQNKFSYACHDYEIKVLAKKNHYTLSIQFEFYNKSKKSLFVAKELPCILSDWFEGRDFIALDFGPDLRDMVEGFSFLTEEIHPGEKRKYINTTSLPRSNKFTIRLKNYFYWLENNVDRKKYKYNTDYNYDLKDLGSSVFYIHMKL